MDTSKMRNFLTELQKNLVEKPRVNQEVAQGLLSAFNKLYDDMIYADVQLAKMDHYGNGEDLSEYQRHGLSMVREGFKSFSDTVNMMRMILSQRQVIPGAILEVIGIFLDDLNTIRDGMHFVRGTYTSFADTQTPELEEVKPGSEYRIWLRLFANSPLSSFASDAKIIYQNSFINDLNTYKGEKTDIFRTYISKVLHPEMFKLERVDRSKAIEYSRLGYNTETFLKFFDELEKQVLTESKDTYLYHYKKQMYDNIIQSEEWCEPLMDKINLKDLV